MAVLVTRTDDSLQSGDFVECNAGTNVEDAQYNGLSRSHSKVAIAGDEDDAVNLALESIDPVRHELAVGSGRASIAKVLGILLLTAGEGGITQVVRDSQLESMLAGNFLLTALLKALTLLRPN